ncbi:MULTISPECIES: Wadjet anti-phage system protein JetD domain-containing protein [unclassified Cryobacterium]|uniref:Wadjet anti-phage system protein JetD domain-containing protein n=1 Tax=unclassified Cryobacterium TaxID=2649013 RepID=UPI00106ABA24|nr:MULTISPECIES: DUF3322 and DUF2220 domain-containing protein [unclassified Cryobacterium]TFC50340.1 hypothetical protein E3O68_18250 [Cryobacterium sp. TMB3-1-2]TFC71925.1 hypothetical protein E3T21_07150 [Cryobacterium sp. TMB3-15]TFC78518.1 hypothetical protein E3T22_03345 [Cryobacterium sp. TMB3-10]TFD44575.1 hypothetical protein E3T58_04405 [Cryobacterium sp. TMB3-12]
MAAPRGMVSVADARARALKKVLSDQRDWAAFGGEDARLEIVLHPPTERAALEDQGAAVAWVQAWQAADAREPTVEVSWGVRQWSRVGAQTVPERCLLRGADAIAGFAGSVAGRDWRVLRDRAALVHEAFAERAADMASTGALAAAIRTHGRTLQQLAELDFATLLHVVAWLAKHPASGRRIRQLPIRGIDTKWLEGHRAVVESLHAAVSGRSSLGLLDPPALMRVRFLDPALRPGGLCHVIAPLEEFAALDVAPSVVFVFENLETMFAMPELPGAVVVHGSGFAAPRLGSIPWIQSGRVLYWGDLDSNGFAILHALRSGCTNVTSVLMDEETLLAYRDLWVPEPKPAAGTYLTLTAGEQRVLERIRSEGNVRLEQERIGWAYALTELVEAAARVPENTTVCGT